MLHNSRFKYFTYKLTSLGYNSFSARYSALFINGAKATDNFVFVVPHVDFSDRIKEKELLQKQLQLRKSNLDLNKIENLWSMYDELKTRKLDYDNKKEVISKELGKLMKSDPNSDVVKKLKIHVNLIKENLKKLKQPLWSAEEAAVLEALKLPNTLHPDTPECEHKVLYIHKTKQASKLDHLIVAYYQDLIDFKKNENYYLKNEAAVFELGAKFYFSSLLRKQNYIQFSNPDFVKSVIIEGCGIDHTNPDESFILHHNEETKVHNDNRLHLTGGSSLCSFMAYYAKNILHGKVFPLKYFTLGRQYVPSPFDEDSLFHVSQSSVVQVFGINKNDQESDILLNELINFLKLTYSKLDYHYRICILPADKLQFWESLRVTVQMYSGSLDSYVEIANISVSGDFISKRLMLTYVDNKVSHFPHIISGTILNVPKFLACVLEQDSKFVLPKPFAVENWPSEST